MKCFKNVKLGRYSTSVGYMFVCLKISISLALFFVPEGDESRIRLGAFSFSSRASFSSPELTIHLVGTKWGIGWVELLQAHARFGHCAYVISACICLTYIQNGDCQMQVEFEETVL